jgi:hypothetical protein
MFILYLLARLPGPSQLMSRLLVFMNVSPLNTRAREALQLFNQLALWFHPNFNNDALVSNLISKILSLLDSGTSFFNIVADLIIIFEDYACIINSPSGDSTQSKSILTKSRSKDDCLSMEFKNTRIQRWQTIILDMLCTLLEAVADQV